ncbi:ABC transporter permease [Bradyrhizobium sp. ISRA463]|uniref:ABC transporter permease n=1 Tax=Bradyrhizobium sp. ISRA463 TaxID=2866199 RepID=UPI00247A7435|nr:ABC transporter permease [Bradyrhizobium sp. ISRA463]WGS17363.1 ABC transporter permease [Bradyrhizobium sp. ISRA463]
MSRAIRQDRPDVVEVKSRFNRALFETPRSGNLPPLTIPVYEPLIDPTDLEVAAGENQVVKRQSLFRNVVSGDSFLNIYIFGIDPDSEPGLSSFSIARGRFLRSEDRAVAVLDQASAQALGVDIGGTFPVRKADGTDLQLTVVGILDKLELRGAPPRSAEAPSLRPESTFVSSGAFVNIQTSEDIFGRESLTDALVIARSASEVPALVAKLQEAFRLEPGVFVTERYSQYQRKVHDFVLTLTLFSAVSIATLLLAGSFAANLLHDIYVERRRQYATLIAVGFRPATGIAPAVVFGLVLGFAAVAFGGLAARAFVPRTFAMPSLMADLGPTEPTIDWVVAGSLVAIAIAAVGIGSVSTVLRLVQQPLAITLSEENL